MSTSLCFGLGSVSAPRSPHLNSAGKRPGRAVILRRPLSCPHCRGPSSRAGSFQATRAPAGPRPPAPGTPEPSVGPCTAVPLAAPRLPSPLGLRLRPLPPRDPSSSLPQSCFHAPGRDPTAPPDFSFSLPSSILDSLWSCLEFPGLARAQSLNYGHNEKRCIRPAAS